MKKILAAFMFFTRLPFWRLANVPSAYFKNIVSLWPLVGWFTAGIMVLVLYSSSLILPGSVAILLAIIARLLLTGCLHEDGLADFLDGFGGGTSKEKTLSIMKDSHIGTYGVIGLVLYFAMFYLLLDSVPLSLAGSAILAADPFCKGISAMIINKLPYVRKEEEAKNKTVYSKMTPSELSICILLAGLSLIWLPSFSYFLAIILPIAIFLILVNFMKRKIGGYTGDCCGATFLLTELSFYLGVCAVYTYLISH